MSDPRELISALFDRADQTEWTDADAAKKLANALRAVLDVCDRSDFYTGTGVLCVAVADIEDAIENALKEPE